MRSRWNFALLILVFGLMVSTVQAGDCAGGFAALASSDNPAVHDFRQAVQNSKFDARTMFFSYQIGGNGDRILVRAEARDLDGSVHAFNEAGQRIRLTTEELATARVSNSEDLIRHFESGERGRVVRALSDEGRDDATREFRARWRQKNFETPHPMRGPGDAPPFMISYVRAGGERMAARVLEVMPNGHVKIRTPYGTEQILGTDAMVSARMAGAASAQSFLERERSLAAELAPRAAVPAPLVKPTVSVQARGVLTREQALATYSENLNRVAPKLDFSNPAKVQGSYHSNGYWRQWMDPKATDGMPIQGWKLHVGATPQSAFKIAESLMPELRRRGIMHKVVDDLKSYAARDPARDTQAGKFITIYPRTDKEAKEIAELVDGILKREGLTQSDFLNPPGELVVRPGVYARFGRFMDGPQLDASGRAIPGSSDLIRLPDGRLVPDQRGVAAPNGVRNPF